MLNAASLVDEFDSMPVLDAASLVDEFDSAPMLNAASLVDEFDSAPMLNAASLVDEFDSTPVLDAAVQMNDIDLTPMLDAASLVDEFDSTPMLDAASLVDEFDSTPVLDAAAQMDNTSIAPMVTGIERAHDIDLTPMFAAAKAVEDFDTALQPTVNLAAQEIGKYPKISANVFDIVEVIRQVPDYQEPFITREKSFGTDTNSASPDSEFSANQPTTESANTPAIEIRRLIAEYITRARTENGGYVELTNTQWISVSLAVGVVVGYCTDPQTGRAVSTALSVYGIAQN